jgi:hypothetical protein
VNTSHGRVTTTLAQNLQFANDQTYNIDSTTYVQNIQVNTNAFFDDHRGGAEWTLHDIFAVFPIPRDD